jgi:hypothetical protein
MSDRFNKPKEPEQFPVVSGLEVPKPDREGGQCAIIPEDDCTPPESDWDAGQFRMFRD